MYRLTSFGTVTLPTAGISGEMPTGPTLDPVLQTINGTFDSRGEDQAPPKFPYTLQHTAIVAGTAASHVRTQVDRLRALRGQKQRLYRQDVAADEHWAWARLIRLTAPIDTKYGPLLQPVTLDFSLSDGWYEYVGEGAWFLDTGQMLDDGLYLDAGAGTAFSLTSSPGTITLTNNGNRTTYNGVFRFTPASELTYVEVQAAGIRWSWDGTVDAGNVLEVDCGENRVTNDGEDAYATFALEAQHLVSGWLPLEPGSTPVVVTFTGGGTVTVNVEYYSGWE